MSRRKNEASRDKAARARENQAGRGRDTSVEEGQQRSFSDEGLGLTPAAERAKSEPRRWSMAPRARGIFP